jgi:LysR family nitrogen assimilation transcriptional regulator
MTDAGHAVYRHAQIILRQMEQAQVDVSAAGNSLAGRVSVGLVPFSSAATLSVELLAETRKRHPGILIHLTESVGQTYSQMIMNGRLELALIHGVGPIKGVKFEPMLSEEFYLVAHRDFAIEADSKPVPIAALDGMPMLMPPAYNFVRRAVDTAFTRSRINLKVVAEVEIVRTLARAVASGLGATIIQKPLPTGSSRKRGNRLFAGYYLHGSKRPCRSACPTRTRCQSRLLPSRISWWS